MTPPADRAPVPAAAPAAHPSRGPGAGATGRHGARAASGLERAAAGGLGLASAAAALALAAAHPLSAPMALALVLAAVMASAVWPLAWLVVLPAAWPILGLAPWTGWLLVEESDLAVLALAAGVWLRHAARPLPEAPGRPAAPQVLAGALLALWIASVLIAGWRGFLDAGGWAAMQANPAWWQGYREPMNALRLAKATLAAVVLWSLWRLARRQAGDALASQRLAQGFAAGLAITALVCVWERGAYVGLTNFSTDYRTVGPFWEMHVGGAALDAFLSLALPLAWFAWRGARTPLGWGVGAVVLGVSLYAALTTFSRIIYLSWPVVALLTALLMARQAARARAEGDAPAEAAAGAGTAAPTPWLPALPIVAGGAAALAWVFPGSGYRGMAAVIGLLLLLMVLVPTLASGGRRRAPVGVWLAAGLVALLAAAVVAALAHWVPKGAYIGYTVVVLGALLAARPVPEGRSRWPGLALLVGLYPAAALAMVLVAGHWGGERGRDGMLPVALLLLALPLPLVLLGRRGAGDGRGAAAAAPRATRPWPAHGRWPVAVTLALGGAAAVIGIFSGGNYMEGRLETRETDSEGRFTHWRMVLDWPGDAGATWVGHGLGRFLDSYTLYGPPELRPGDIRLAPPGSEAGVLLQSGLRNTGFGSMLRLTQTLGTPPPGPWKLGLVARSPDGARLHGEVCFKHLIYPDHCKTVSLNLPQPGWVSASLDIDGAALLAQRSAWPQLLVLALANASEGKRIELRRVSLTDGAGREWVHNGDFSAGGARWFHTSDRNHMPWHAKNLAVHLWHEQGALGLAALSLLGLAALANAFGGPGRRHPLAAPLIGALVGLALVGAIDSLIDMPRITTLLLWLALIAASLPAPQRPRPAGGPDRPERPPPAAPHTRPATAPPRGAR